jgi:hypothetical protein
MDSTYFYVKIDNNSDLSGFKEYFYLWSTVPDEEPPIIDDRRYAVPLFTEYHLGEGHRATSSLSAGTYDFAPLGPIDLSEVSPFSVSAMRIYATANTGKSQGGDYGLWVYDVGDMSIVGKDYQDRPNPYDSTLPILQSTLGNNFYPPELEHFQSADFIETAGDTLVSRWYNSSKLKFLVYNDLLQSSINDITITGYDYRFMWNGVYPYSRDETHMKAGRNYLHIIAVDHAGNRSEVGHYVFDVDPNPPLPVTEAIARARIDGNIYLTWSPVTDLHSGFSFYRVYRSTSEATLGQQINQDGSSRLAYTDRRADAADEIEYFYTVRAVDKMGNENTSDANIQVGSKSSLPTLDLASITVETVPVRLTAGDSGLVKIAGELNFADAKIVDAQFELANGVITFELDTAWLSEEGNTDWFTSGTIDALDQGRYPVRIVVNGTELDYEGEVNVVGPPTVVDGSLTVTVLPAAPQAGEKIVLSVAGSFPSPDATLVGQSVTREGDTFLIELASAWTGESGSNEATAFDTTAGVGYLSAGQYVVKVQAVNGDLLSLSPFTVIEGPPLEGPVALDFGGGNTNQGQRLVKGGRSGRTYELALHALDVPSRRSSLNRRCFPNPLVDYAILQDQKPVILFECKASQHPLDGAHTSQLQRYYHATEARFAVLTNGVNYRFFADLDKSNVMDALPFLEIDLLDIKESLVDELKKFTKAAFNEEDILSTASQLKYTREIHRSLNENYDHPSDDFIRLFVGRVYKGRLTQTTIEEFTPIVRRAFHQFVNDRVRLRLKPALTEEIEAAPVEAESAKAQGVDVDDAESEAQIITTEEELHAFYLVKAILHGTVDPDRVAIRDRVSYCGILLDDNNRKPICRLHFNGAQKYIGLFDNDRKEERISIESLNDVYQYTDRLLATIALYDEPATPENTNS